MDTKLPLLREPKIVGQTWILDVIWTDRNDDDTSGQQHNMSKE